MTSEPVIKLMVNGFRLPDPVRQLHVPGYFLPLAHKQISHTHLRSDKLMFAIIVLPFITGAPETPALSSQEKRGRVQPNDIELVENTERDRKKDFRALCSAYQQSGSKHMQAR